MVEVRRAAAQLFKRFLGGDLSLVAAPPTSVSLSSADDGSGGGVPQGSGRGRPAPRAMATRPSEVKCARLPLTPSTPVADDGYQYPLSAPGAPKPPWFPVNSHRDV